MPGAGLAGGTTSGRPRLPLDPSDCLGEPGVAPRPTLVPPAPAADGRLRLPRTVRITIP
jgi:hypothetical protein